MRGTILPSSPSRIKGRASLVRRLRALLIASHRFGRHRAATRDEVLFAAQLIDGLTATLAAIESQPIPGPDTVAVSRAGAPPRSGAIISR
jgi:hypothetical protein